MNKHFSNVVAPKEAALDAEGFRLLSSIGREQVQGNMECSQLVNMIINIRIAHTACVYAVIRCRWRLFKESSWSLTLPSLQRS